MCLPIGYFMSIVDKKIGYNTYRYEVKYNPDSKKQEWIYQGKIHSDDNILKVVGKLFSNQEIKQIKESYYQSVKNRYGIQRNTLELICDRLRIKL